jgi:RNA polymerase sigma-70 factor, ECF subfamily
VLASEHAYERIIELTGLERLRGRLAAALGALPGDQRRAVELRLVEDRSYGDVARELGLPEQVARARVARGLRSLAAQSREL